MDVFDFWYNVTKEWFVSAFHGKFEYFYINVFHDIDAHFYNACVTCLGDKAHHVGGWTHTSLQCILDIFDIVSFDRFFKTFDVLLCDGGWVGYMRKGSRVGRVRRVVCVVGGRFIGRVGSKSVMRLGAT